MWEYLATVHINLKIIIVWSLASFWGPARKQVLTIKKNGLSQFESCHEDNMEIRYRKREKS